MAVSDRRLSNALRSITGRVNKGAELLDANQEGWFLLMRMDLHLLNLSYFESDVMELTGILKPLIPGILGINSQAEYCAHGFDADGRYQGLNQETERRLLENAWRIAVIQRCVAHETEAAFEQ